MIARIWAQVGVVQGEGGIGLSSMGGGEGGWTSGGGVAGGGPRSTPYACSTVDEIAKKRKIKNKIRRHCFVVCF